MKYIEVEKLKAEIERLKEETPIGICEYDKGEENGRMEVLTSLQSTIASLQQEQPDFDDVDPKHLVHSHYTKVRETKTGRVFWAEYSSEAAEWYEAGTGKAYSISKVEIVKEQPGVDLEKEIEKYYYDRFAFISSVHNPTLDILTDIANHFYELGKTARKDD